METKEGNNFKIVVIGESSVGKTTLLHRFTENEFKKFPKLTIGVDFSIYRKQIDGEIVTGRYWDTAGLERYRSVLDVCYRGCEGAVVVYDVTKRDSFLAVNQWVDAVKQNSDNENIPMILLANKIDLVKNSLSLSGRRRRRRRIGHSTSTSPCVSKNPSNTRSRRRRRSTEEDQRNTDEVSQQGDSNDYQLKNNEHCYPRMVSVEEGLELSKKLGFTKFFETSAKTGKSVKKSFDYILRNAFEFYSDPANSNVRNNSDPLFQIQSIDEDFRNAGRYDDSMCFGLCRL